MLTDFAIKNYRSVKDVWLRLKPVTVVVGANGSGKSNIYRALQLMASTATGELAHNVAMEGGLSSIAWCGRLSKNISREVDLSIITESTRYDLSFGYPPEGNQIGHKYFSSDIEIKKERFSKLTANGQSNLFERKRVSCRAKDASGQRTDYTNKVRSNQSVLYEIKEPHKYPYLSNLSSKFLNWRFYHRFRTDATSPLRLPQLPVATPNLANDGSNLVAAIATILEMGDEASFLNSFEDAFPGASLSVEHDRMGLNLKVKYDGITRMLDAGELSEGTLQYICLLTALYSLDPPEFLALNEPESSIHPDLIEPLAKLIVRASETSQIWVTTHSQLLADFILEYGGYDELHLEKIDGETRLVGVGLGGYRFDEEEVEDELDDDFE